MIYSSAPAHTLDVSGSVAVSGTLASLGNKIAFLAYGSGGTSAPSGGAAYSMPLTNTSYNYGGGYNTTQHWFAAPIKGIYSFTGTCGGINVAGAFGLFNVTTSAWIAVHSSVATTDWVSVSATIELNAGDCIIFRNNNSLTVTSDANTHFMGALITPT